MNFDFRIGGNGGNCDQHARAGIDQLTGVDATAVAATAAATTVSA